jgi:anti-sigma factor RsiW
MSGNLRSEEIEELLGAYALDAVDDDERAAVERHLVHDPRARAEVADHRAVASLLASTGGPAPSGVWDKIAAALDDEQPPALDLAKVVPMAPRSASVPAPPRAHSRPARWTRWATGVAAAAAVAVVAMLGSVVVNQRSEIDDLESANGLVRQAEVAFADDTNTTVALVSEDGASRVDAVVQPDGTGYLDAGALVALPDDRTYQLWGVMPTADGDAVVSLGVLGNDPSVSAFQAPGVKALVVTEEIRGGVVSSSQPALLAGDVV